MYNMLQTWSVRCSTLGGPGVSEGEHSPSLAPKTQDEAFDLVIDKSTFGT